MTFNTGEKTSDTKRLAIQDELGDISWNLVSKLADAKLVVTGQNNEGQNTVELVHEALIDNWDTLKQWVDTERVFRAWQERLRMLKAQWIKTNKNSGSLLRGVILREAVKELRERGDELKDEKEFITKSVKHNKKDIFFFCSIIVLVVSTMLYMYFVEKRQSQAKKIEQANSFAQSASLFVSSRKPLDAIISGIKAGRIFQKEQIINTTVLSSLNEGTRNIREYNRLTGHKILSHQISFSPDGKKISSLDAENTFRLWDLKGKIIYALKNTDHYNIKYHLNDKNIFLGSYGIIKSLDIKGNLRHTVETHDDSVIAFSSDGKKIASSNRDNNNIKIWSSAGILLYTMKGHEKVIFDFAFSNDGKTMVSSSLDGTVKLWDDSGELLNSFKNCRHPVFSPDSKTISLVDNNKTIKLYDRKGRLVRVFEGYKNITQDIVFSPDGKMIASSNEDDNTLQIWDINGRLRHVLKGHQRMINTILFSPDSKIIASASMDTTVKLWDINGNILDDFKHDSSVMHIAFSPDGKTIASGSFDPILRLWSVNSKLPHIIKPYKWSVNSMALSPDGKTLVSASQDGENVKFWDMKGKQYGLLKQEVKDFNSPVFRVAFSPDSKTIAFAHSNGIISLVDINSKLIRLIESPKSSRDIKVLVFSPDGKTIAFTRNTNIEIWNTTGNILRIINTNDEPVNSMTFSPDSENIVSASSKNIRIWDTTGNLIRTIPAHHGRINSVAVSPDGKTLVSASNKNIKFWSIAGNLISDINAHEGEVNSVAFSPDGKTIASGGDDRTVRLWDINSNLIHTFNGHHASVTEILFSPDSKIIASASGDGTIRFWSSSLDASMENACDWVRDYLQNSQDIKEESDRHICDDVKRSN